MKILIIIFLLLSGCGAEQAPGQSPGLTKIDWIPDAAESSIVVWNGELMTVASTRELSTTQTGETTVKLYRGAEVISVPAPRFAFISAIVDKDILYIFGTIQNRYIQMVSSSNLYAWTSPVTVFEVSGVYNTSVAKDGTGFIMAYETDIGVPYTVQFAKSKDLVNWLPVSVPFHLNSYAACPTIRYIDGKYYVFYLSSIGGKYVTLVERSNDLLSWEKTTSGYAVLAPEATEGINASDMDMTELNGVTYMVYSVGDQATWGRLRIAVFNGTFSQFVSALFSQQPFVSTYFTP